MGYSSICFGGIGEIYPLVELLDVDGGAEIGLTIFKISVRNRDRKLEVSPLGEWTFISESRSEVSSSVGSSYGRI